MMSKNLHSKNRLINRNIGYRLEVQPKFLILKFKKTIEIDKRDSQLKYDSLFKKERSIGKLFFLARFIMITFGIIIEMLIEIGIINIDFFWIKKRSMVTDNAIGRFKNEE